MATIDILCVVDANFLVANVTPGTLSNPTSIGSYASSDTYIFMIADGQYASNNQGQSELTVSASVGDTLRWTITDPSTGLIGDQQSHSYSCILYGFSSGTANGVITTPACNSTPALMYYNSTIDPATPAAAAYMCAAWTSSVIATGSVQYSWNFQVIDNTSGNVVGYYCWDPFISVS